MSEETETAEYPKLNLELLNQVMDHIKAHRESWDQSTWRCETGFCFAGWAAELTPGVEWAYPVDSMWNTVLSVSDAYGHGDEENIQKWATKALGLTDSEADDLFAGTNKMRDLKRHVARLNNGERWDYGYEGDEE